MIQLKESNWLQALIRNILEETARVKLPSNDTLEVIVNINQADSLPKLRYFKKNASQPRLSRVYSNNRSFAPKSPYQEISKSALDKQYFYTIPNQDDPGNYTDSLTQELKKLKTEAKEEANEMNKELNKIKKDVDLKISKAKQMIQDTKVKKYLAINGIYLKVLNRKYVEQDPSKINNYRQSQFRR